MHETGCSGLVHWDDPEGWDGREVEGGLKMGNTCTPMADSCECMAKPLQYCKVISLQLKKKKKTPGLIVLNSLHFCLSGKLSIPPSNLKESLAGRVFLVVVSPVHHFKCIFPFPSGLQSFC